MSDRQSIAVPVIKAKRIELSPDPRGDVQLAFETPGDTEVVLVLPMGALAELEALLALASQEQAKHQPKQ